MTNERYRAKQRAIRNGDTKCFYCGKQCDEGELWVDHIVPKSRGGSHTKGNLTTSCKKCNMLKSDLSLSEFAKKIDSLKAETLATLAYTNRVDSKLFQIKEDMERKGKWEVDLPQ